MVEGLKGGKGVLPPSALAGAASGPERIRATQGASGPGGPGPRNDIARLELRGLARELAKAPPVDATRVAELRLALTSGTYRPDAERIAAAMIALETGRTT